MTAFSRKSRVVTTLLVAAKADEGVTTASKNAVLTTLCRTRRERSNACRHRSPIPRRRHVGATLSAIAMPGPYCSEPIAFS